MLTEELLKKAMVELNEDPNKTYDDIQAIREWLKKQPHINANTDDDNILIFLRAGKFSLERTKGKIETYYTMKTALPQLYQNLDPTLPEIIKILGNGYVIPLQKQNQSGTTVVIIRLSAWNYSTIPFESLMKVAEMSTIACLEKEVNQVGGVEIAFDLRDTSIGILGVLTPSLLKTLINGWLNAQPFRVKGLHALLMPSFIEPLFIIFKSLLKEKISKRVHVHSDIDKISESLGFSKDDFPTEYGGKGESVMKLAEDWKEELLKRRDMFIKNDLYKVDENKRMGTPKSALDLFGTDGSFRKLNID